MLAHVKRPILRVAAAGLILLAGLPCLSGCGGNYSSPPPATISVSVSPTSANVQAGIGTQNFTATLTNDAYGRGVTWALSGSGCSGNFCGSLSNTTATSVTYTAPATAPTPATVTLTATSVTDTTQKATATITVTQPAGTVSVTISPKRGGITINQTQQFTATVSGSSNTSVTWQVDGTPGGNTTVGTIDSTGKYTPPSTGGSHTVTAVSVADSTKSASATIGVIDLGGVFTWHNDLARTGQNTKEYALTPALVTTSTFGKLFSCAVDAAAYAQPLWVANLTIQGGTHNVIFVATVHNTVYAFDADSNANPCVPYWQKSLMASGETWLSSGDVGTSDIQPDIGIIGTPVIDPTTTTLYVVSKSKDTSGVSHQRLHALDLATGNEKFSSPVQISATVSGTGDGSSGGILPFNALTQNQRPGLLLLNGVVYITWASHGDNGPYHGWVIGYSASNLTQQVAVYNTTPNGGLGGIWMSAAAPAADSAGNIYFATGNGTFNGTDEFGDSVLKLGAPSAGTLPRLDFFTPFNQASLNSGDVDLGSGGVLIPPDLSSGAHPHLLVQTGKDGTIHLLNRDPSQMGQYCNGCASDTQIVQELPNAINGMFGTPAYWNGNVYFGGAQGGDNLKAFSFNSGGSGLLSTSPTSVSTQVFNFPGPTPSVSANGSSNAIVWALDNSQYGPPTPNGTGPTVLHSYDATNLANEFWNSSMAANNRDTAGNAVKFTVPTVANGKVYVGTATEITVYGLLPN